MQACFGQIVTLLLRSPADRQRPLQDLEWLVIPAVNAGQVAVAEAHAKDTGSVMPIGAILWVVGFEQMSIAASRLAGSAGDVEAGGLAVRRHPLDHGGNGRA